MPLYSRLKEFRIESSENFEIGQELTVSAFKVGDKVKVTGTTKGRGFQGVIKRWNKHGGPKLMVHIFIERRVRLVCVIGRVMLLKV